MLNGPFVAQESTRNYRTCPSIGHLSKLLMGVWSAVLLKLKIMGRRLSRSHCGSRVSVSSRAVGL